MDKMVNKWASGMSYGPILSQTDLYLLNTELEINPLLGGQDGLLQFSLVTGTNYAGDPNIVGKDEPATLPRISQLTLITRQSPWCTIIKKDTGVTVGDVCSTVFKEYSEHDVTDAEFGALHARFQEHVKRTAQSNQMQRQPQGQWGGGGGYYTPQHIERIRRSDWLREKVHMDGLVRDDNYVKMRLGFRAPNILVLELTG